MNRLAFAIALLPVITPMVTAQPGTFNYLENRSVSQLDPFTYFSNPVNDRIASLLFGYLFAIDTESKVVPDMVEAISEDPSHPGVFTIRLKPRMTWKDGSVVRAKDVIFTIGLIRNRKTDCTGDPRLRVYVDEIASEREIGPLEFMVAFKKPLTLDQAMVRLMLPIVPAEVLKRQYVKRNDRFTEEPVGSGAYYFDSWAGGSHFFVRNKNYHGVKTNDRPIERIAMVPAPDNKTRGQQFLSGKFHLIVDVPPGDLDQIRSSGDFEVKAYESLSYDYVGFNFENEILRIPAVREAMSIALDRKKIIRDSYNGKGLEVSGPFPPSSPFVDTDVRPDAYNPKRAREILDGIGARFSGGGQVRQFKGKSLRFRLVYPEKEGGEKDAYEVATQQIRGYMRDVGIEIVLSSYPEEKYREEVVEKHNFDLAFNRWRFTDLSGDPSLLFVTGGNRIYNYIGYTNQSVDQLFTEFRAATDTESRKNMGKRIHRVLASERPYIFLWSAYNHSAINRARIGDVVINPYSYFSTITDWRLIR